MARYKRAVSSITGVPVSMEEARKNPDTTQIQTIDTDDKELLDTIWRIARDCYYGAMTYQEAVTQILGMFEKEEPENV